MAIVKQFLRDDKATVRKKLNIHKLLGLKTLVKVLHSCREAASVTSIMI